MLATHAVGIDLGTTYSCIAHLNERGEPLTLENQEGEMCTPSVVMYEDGEEVVGTEAWRNSIMHPDRVVQNAKRFMGDAQKTWLMNGRPLTPVDVSAAVLRKLLRDAAQKIGPIERAVITVPAQFSDLQREATIQASRQAGLKQVDIINEPVAAALCYVLGKEGLWFTELAEEQKILVYDLGGGTFDLSLVRYQQNEVRVIASSGDLHLGGIDWNDLLLKAVAEQFQREFGADPRKEPESLQALHWEVEQCKRSLSTRPKASLICQHGGKRKTYQIDQQQFNQLAAPLVRRTEEITKQMLKDNRMGWAHVNVVLTTGGSSRMPMIRSSLQRLSGRTLNTSLSPDQAIAHGAAYYAGMLLTNNEFARSILNQQAAARLSKLKQQSVNARGLGILVRDEETGLRVPHYMISANTPLPTSVTHTFGTVVPNQRRVMLRIVESGTSADAPFVEIGDCAIDGLPADLPVDSHVGVTISYDASAKIHVSARDVTSGKEAQTQITRVENVLTVGVPPSGGIDQLKPEPPLDRLKPEPEPVRLKPELQPVKPVPRAGKTRTASQLEESAVPIPLCNDCGEPLNTRGVCSTCVPAKPPMKAPVKLKPATSGPKSRPAPVPAAAIRPASADGADLARIFEPDDDDIFELPAQKPAAPRRPGVPEKPAAKPAAPAPRSASRPKANEDDDFWILPEK